ncbi:hypothetical protein ZWY2020_047283 [Hordeum vulgare]|nr:hypothetical protein ZWY2020_047283 [Hordeum vulgare]
MVRRSPAVWSEHGAWFAAGWLGREVYHLGLGRLALPCATPAFPFSTLIRRLPPRPPTATTCSRIRLKNDGFTRYQCCALTSCSDEAKAAVCFGGQCTRH